MTAAGQVRSEIVSRLKAAGLDAAEAYEDERFRERSGSVVAVGAKQAELAHAGLMNYLGEQYDAESGRGRSVLAGSAQNGGIAGRLRAAALRRAAVGRQLEAV